MEETDTARSGQFIFLLSAMVLHACTCTLISCYSISSIWLNCTCWCQDSLTTPKPFLIRQKEFEALFFGKDFMGSHQKYKQFRINRNG